MRRNTDPTPDEWELDHVASGTRALFNKDTRVRDQRSDENQTPIPDSLFELVVRGVSDALQAVETHDESLIRFDAYDADEDEGGMYIEVTMYTRSTPNTLNYLANSLPNVANMGASLNTAYNTPKTRQKSIPDGWMEVRYRFYPNDNWEMTDSLNANLPPVEYYNPDETTAPV